MIPHDVDGCCSDLTLDRFRAGEMSADDVVAQRAHLATATRCAARLAALEAIRAEFLAQPPLQFPAPAASRRARPRFVAVAAALAAAAAVAVVVVTPPETRTKGDGPPATVSLFVSRDGRVLSANEAAPLHPGDAVRGRVTAQRAAWVGVIEVEADGDVARLLPAAGPLQQIAVGDTELDGASRLDEQLGAIDLVALLCADDVIIDGDVLAQVARGEAPAGCALEHHRFEKTGVGTGP